MKLRKIHFLMLAALLAFIPETASAWGSRAHAAIAYIAEQHMTPKAKKTVNEILDGKSLVYYASWMDTYKPYMLIKYTDKNGNEKTRTIPHTFKVTMELTPRHDPPHEGVYTLNEAVANLRDYKNISDSLRLVSMQILAHLVGDIHCPGHVKYADGRDREIGHDIPVTFYGNPYSYHRLWDDVFVDKFCPGKSWTDLAYMADRASRKEIKEIQSGTIEDWAQDIIDSTKDIWYVQEGDELGLEYVTKYRDLAYRQIERAGLRLAKLLNDLFD